jgi:hypothetical protein
VPAVEEPVTEVDEAGVVAPAAEAEEAEIPDWLESLRPAGVAALGAVAAKETVEDVPVEAEETVKPAAVPEWLADLRPGAPEEPEPVAEGIVEEAGVPDWLVPTDADEEDTLARAEIPEWLLALKPRELREEEVKEEEEVEALPDVLEELVEDTGLLIGLQGTLPAEMLIVQPRAAIVTEVAVPTTDIPQAKLFEEIVGRPPEVAPKEIAKPRGDILGLLPKWLIYIALIIVVTLPLLLGEPLVPRTIPPSPAVTSLHTAVEAVDSEQPVLLAFDYDPTTSGEMDLVARAIVGHLMDRGARIVIVSLLPAGPATAQSLLDDMASQRPEYADSYGTRYINLGFLPGESAAVRLLSQSVPAALPKDLQGTRLSELPAIDGIASIQDFDLVIELAAEQRTLRWWIEQASAPYEVPMGAGVSAAIEPMARAYYDTDPQQLIGIVGGVPGVAMYETMSSSQEQPQDSTAARLDSQLGGHLVFVLVLLAGGGIWLVRRGTGREH